MTIVTIYPAQAFRSKARQDRIHGALFDLRRRWEKELSGPKSGGPGRPGWAGLGWPLPEALSDDNLELLLFPAAPSVP
ncbi:hypothetical protein, partial [Poseidonocella sp. HB161398]|uniref:hypothetical protein n=1 Tax=Poseidonocella sp. HB161398 TaxID=2320855 RepID=UPI00197CB846